MIKRYAVAYLCFSLILIQIVFAGTTGKISGKVTDSKTKEGIPSAVVTVVGTSLGAASDMYGSYVIVNVPPGTYAVQVSYIGYQPTKITNVGVNVDYTTTLNIQLNESSVELGEYVVEGERNPMIRQDQTNPVVAVTAENIQSLPVTSIATLVGLQAGVVTSDDGKLHIRGGRDNEISFTLNGVSVNNPYDNLSSIGVATNAVQEVTVSTGTFSAEYGNALSGIVNYVTKEGGSKLNGSVRFLTGDYFSNDEHVFPHIKTYQPFNNPRAEATLGGPTGLDDLSFYISGVYNKNNGYLYGNRIYNPSDFYVTPSEFTRLFPYTDTLGNPISDPNNPGYAYLRQDTRLNKSTDAPFYFNPLGRKLRYQRLGNLNVMSPYFDSTGLPSGDGALVPLNTSMAYNIQGNIAYRISSTMKIKYEFVYDNAVSQDAYYYSYRFNPDGRPTNYSDGLVQTLDWTHTISNAAFYTFKLSYSDANDKTYAYENINDKRYLPSFYQTALPIVGFLTGGTSLGRTFRTTSTLGAKFDMQAQLFDVHEVKFGAELRLHTLDYESYSLQFVNAATGEKIFKFDQLYYNESITYKAQIPDDSAGYIYYKKNPSQLSAYIQDKIELDKSIILNAGLRYELFDPSAKYNPNLSEELGTRVSFVNQGITDAKVKHMISPRISIAYPITDQGVIRFSYGHFYQMGNLSRLYTNTTFRAAGSQPIFGNADVKPQRSIQYELGLQQGLTQDLRLEIVGFYKDMKDYIFRQIVYASKGDIRYEVETNLDYANSRGLTISLFQRRAPGSIFSSSLDYTFSIAEGNRTEPRSAFFYSEKSGKSTETFLVPLDFDRRHTLTGTINFSQPDDFIVSNIVRLQSGAPYTPVMPASLSTNQAQYIQNSSVKPFQWTADLKAEKIFVVDGVRYSLFVQVDNLFDVQNQRTVYANSGQSLYNTNQVSNPKEFAEMKSRIEKGQQGLIPLSAIEKYYVNPQNVSAPRLARVGFSAIF